VSALSYAEAFEAMDGAYAVTGVLVGQLSDEDFGRATRCEGWTVRDVIFHQLLDAQRVLVALATPSEKAPDRDFVDYWHGYPAGDPDAGVHAEFVRMSAAAYPSTRVLAEHWRETSVAARHAARTADAGGRVGTQGLVLDVPDFLATVAVEAGIHYLDLTVHLADAPPPAALALTLTRRTLDGLLGTPFPLAWDDTMCALKGTGRETITADDAKLLGALARRLPLLA
jgi:hypothetical protein